MPQIKINKLDSHPDLIVEDEDEGEILKDGECWDCGDWRASFVMCLQDGLWEVEIDDDIGLKGDIPRGKWLILMKGDHSWVKQVS